MMSLTHGTYKWNPKQHTYLNIKQEEDYSKHREVKLKYKLKSPIMHF